MRTKLALTTAAALLAGTMFAAAQTTPQPGGIAPHEPPQGSDNADQRNKNMKQSPRAPMGGTTGQGQRSGPPATATPQPGGTPPMSPPQGSEPADPRGQR
ncbi:MAG: hypothetical protein ACRECO_09070 [Xanthobacteraceae bacterium]